MYQDSSHELQKSTSNIDLSRVRTEFIILKYPGSLDLDKIQNTTIS